MASFLMVAAIIKLVRYRLYLQPTAFMKNAHYAFLAVTFISFVVFYGLIALLS
jgi:hypothetical protein